MKRLTHSSAKAETKWQSSAIVSPMKSQLKYENYIAFSDQTYE